MKFKLDFTIYSSKERLEAIKQIDLSSLTKSELETVTNYVLYGKDDDGTSSVDRKEIQIKTKFNSYQKNRTVSLEGLMESPTFDENIFQKDRIIYKKKKISIKDYQKEKIEKIPGMIELWKEIDRVQALLEQAEQQLKDGGADQDTQDKVYFLKHQLIELRTQQYYLLDSENQTIVGKKNRFEFHTNPTDSHCSYPILPRGVFKEEHDRLFANPFYDTESQAAALPNEQDILNSGKPFFDFRNEEHLYQLIQHYEELQASIQNYPDSLVNNLLWTLDFYIEKANLSPQQLLIVQDKKLRLSNKAIGEHLKKELGIEHRENYISTIWNKAVRLIVEAVELNYDEFLCKDYKKAWKRCNRCGEWYLRDPRNFVRKARASDGLTGRCKRCDKEIRQAQKIKY